MNYLTEGIHYYFNETGLVVLTEQYHLEKGYCCGNGCLHCPYQYENVPEPGRSVLLEKKGNTPPAQRP
ncbi:MAG: hypothetical protein HYZ15_01290 [Sphingobacteriales bacterium]|nr:hypothetical protein [Sphingobacteriales bacterium]